MRIHVTGLRGMPGVMGGIESHCEELLPRVKAHNPDLDIAVLCRAPYVPEGRRSFKGVDLVPLPSPKSKYLEAIVATFIAILYAFVSRAKVVHIHAIGPSLLAPLARILGLHVVVTHHGADYERAKWGKLARLALRLGEHASLIWAHRVIAISPSLAARLKEVFPTQAYKVVYIPNGAPKLPDTEPDTEAAIRRLGLAPKSYILAVGRLVPEKGFDDLIDAFETGNQPEGRKLVIVGGADHHSDYVHALHERASDRVLFLGVQPRSMIKCLYEHCELFAMPSHHEGLPIAALEAASCSAPMVLSDIAANLDLEFGPDHYFPVGDVRALARRLEGTHDRLAVESRLVQRRFDWDVSAIQTADLYRSLVPRQAIRQSREPIGETLK